MSWLGSWANRLKITISNTNVDATLTDFPVLVKLSTASGIGDVDVSAVFDELGSDANRKKIAVTSSNGTTQLYAEIERWDDANELAWLHIKVPSVSSSAETILYLYYDSAQADNTSYIGDTTDAVTHNVWDTNFKAVYHMAQDPNGDVADAIKDSTSNQLDLTPAGAMTTADLIDAKVGKGIDFDSADYAFSTNWAASCLNDGHTLELICKVTEVTFTYANALAVGAPATGQIAYLYRSSSTIYWAVGTHSDDVETTATLDVGGNYQYIAQRYDGTTARFYKDATAYETNDISLSIPDNMPIYIGKNSSGYEMGLVGDEVRISDTERSVAWIKATYHSLWDSLVAFETDGNIEVSATTATLTITQKTANVNAEISFTTTAASLTIAANAAEVVPGTLVSADSANLTITAYDANVEHPINIIPTPASLTITANNADVFVGVIVPCASVSLSAISNAARITTSPTLLIEDGFQIYDTIKSGWVLTGSDTLAFTEVVDKILGITASDPLTFSDVATSNWNGTEEIGSTLQMIGAVIIGEVFNETNSETLTITDAPSYIHQMISSIAEPLGFTEGVTASPEFNSVIAEALAITGVVEVLTSLYNTNSETLALTDTLGVGWSKSVSDTLAIADTVTPTFYAMIALTDSIAFTESVLGRFEINENISDTIGFATTLALQRILTNTIEDTISFGITIELDGELWECWVMNGNQFNFSVYSNFNFNSFCSYNDQAFGCRADGIYLLDGTTDNGEAFKAGIVLPETYFSSSHKKRFRSAYFGLSGGVTPAIRLETSSGSQTYTITNSKANISRSLYGRKWVLKVQDFDEMDFIELCPIILTR